MTGAHAADAQPSDDQSTQATLSTPPTLPTVAERAEQGRAARVRAPRTALADPGLSATRGDPIALLEAQNVSRVAELVPLRYNADGVLAVRVSSAGPRRSWPPTSPPPRPPGSRFSCAVTPT